MKINRAAFFEGWRLNFGRLAESQFKALDYFLDFVENDSTQTHIPTVAYQLATVHWETNRTFEPVIEAYWLSENWRKRNLRYYPWYGRGYVQLTWKENYEKASESLSIDLISDPSKALNPKYAYLILTVGMTEGWFGDRLDKHINQTKVDYFHARKSVNILDQAAEIKILAETYEEILNNAVVGSEQARPALPTITPSNAAKTIPILQVIVGVEPDGVIGPRTIEAIKKYQG
jgi:hypothetical protein